MVADNPNIPIPPSKRAPRINQSWYTSETDEWATPRWVFDALHREFRFTLDPCATPGNAKCPLYFTR